MNLINLTIQQDSQNLLAEVKKARKPSVRDEFSRYLPTCGNYNGYKLLRFRKLATIMAITSRYNDNKTDKTDLPGGNSLELSWRSVACHRGVDV